MHHNRWYILHLIAIHENQSIIVFDTARSAGKPEAFDMVGPLRTNGQFTYDMVAQHDILAATVSVLVL